MKNNIPIQFFKIKIIIKDDQKILKISSDSIRNENSDVLLFKDQIQNFKGKYLINEYNLSNNSLCYEIGPTKINTLQNTVNDLFNHIELSTEITKAADNIKEFKPTL